jgi:CubicO group peptidase (beta-lactamase class C family)
MHLRRLQGLLAFASLLLPACSSPTLEPRAEDGPPSTGGPSRDAGEPSSDGGAHTTKPTVVQKDIPAIDQAVGDFMQKNAIPGVSIAITRSEKLVYAKSYGKDGSTEQAPVTNASLYRVASVSKTLTSAAIMRLLEAGKLSLDSSVFGASGILSSDFSSSNLAAMGDITVGHLLHHTSGNWPNDGTDPMFAQPTKSIHELIQWTLDTYPDRGMRGTYAYSNFGFCLLGRIIEKLSGKSYAQFVTDEILAPAGITDMVIGGSTLAERKANEVTYASTDGDPYAVNDISRMDANGGWIASATDLMRFVVRVDGFTNKPDFFSADTIHTMTTASAGNPNYACGWSVNAAGNWWHTGLLIGATSEIIRAQKGLSWAILANAGGTSSPSMISEMDQLIWPFVNDPSTPWQDDDQF